MDAERRHLNILKGLLIVLVVVGHFGQTIANNLPVNIAFIGQGIILFIYLFHMPLFLFISGYLSRNAKKRQAQALRDLLVPYILFQVFVGVALAIIAKSGEVLRNIFNPYMGSWYLLTLFSYRITLPEIRKIRGILLLGVLLTSFSCLMTGIGGEFALKKTLGFFVYFIAGFIIGIPNKKISKKVAALGLAIVFIVIVVVTWRTDWYSFILSILSRGANVNDFSNWYTAVLAYSIAFILSSLICYLVGCAIPDRCNWLEKQGQDTMPMYLSHLLLFLIIGYFVKKDNWVITVMISCLGTIFSLWIFSREWYRNLFHIILDSVKSLVFCED